jgi:hypothetical protein
MVHPRPMHILSPAPGPGGDSEDDEEEEEDDLWDEESDSEEGQQRAGGSVAQSSGGGQRARSSHADKKCRITQACDSCRRRKRKCDGVQPCCGACGRLGLQCSYQTQMKKRGPQAGVVKRLRAEVKLLENELNREKKTAKLAQFVGGQLAIPEAAMPRLPASTSPPIKMESGLPMDSGAGGFGGGAAHESSAEGAEGLNSLSLSVAANSRVRNRTYIDTYFTLLNNTSVASRTLCDINAAICPNRNSCSLICCFLLVFVVCEGCSLCWRSSRSTPSRSATRTILPSRFRCRGTFDSQPRSPWAAPSTATRSTPARLRAWPGTLLPSCSISPIRWFCAACWCWPSTV